MTAATVAPAAPRWPAGRQARRGRRRRRDGHDRRVIASVIQTDSAMSLRSNLSSWYVLPPFRGYAPMLLSRLLKNPDVTYVNVSPAPHTLPIILAQGFVPLSSGKFFVPINPFARLGNAKVQLIKPDDSEIPGLDQFERDLLLLAHARYGCISVSCQTPDGAYPFVFRPRLIKRGVNDYAGWSESML